MKTTLAALPLFFCTALFSQTDSSSFYLQKALGEKTKGHTLFAIRSLEKAQTFDNKNSRVVAELATAYLDVRMPVKAKEKFAQLESLGAATADTYKQLMNLNFGMRQFNDAVKYAQQLKKAEPAANVDYLIGRSYYEMDDLGKAIPLLDVAANAEPKNADIPHLLAIAYTNMQNFKQAIPYFQKATSLEPTNARFVYEMALAYYGMNDDQNALKYMLEAGEKGYKMDNEYLQNLSTALMNAGKFEQGLAMMKQTLAKRPTDIGLMDMIAEACYDAGKHDEAINFYTKILEVDSKKADALYMMGMAYQKKGQAENGRLLCEKAIAMDPSLRNLKQDKKTTSGL